MHVPASRVYQQPVVRRVRTTRLWPVVVALALVLPCPVVAQDQLDTLRIDSLMAVAADRVQSAAIAAAREDADAVLAARTDLFGYGGLFGEVLGEFAVADCDSARDWVNSAAEKLFWLSHSLSLAWDRSSDGEMDRWPAGPEVILDELESLQDMWADFKEENRESCVGLAGGSIEELAKGRIGSTDTPPTAFVRGEGSPFRLLHPSGGCCLRQGHSGEVTQEHPPADRSGWWPNPFQDPSGVFSQGSKLTSGWPRLTFERLRGARVLGQSPQLI